MLLSPTLLTLTLLASTPLHANSAGGAEALPALVAFDWK